jgi:ABC-type transport system involved in cytochrome bd biosynthesis fused ATPase/permease subunit
VCARIEIPTIRCTIPLREQVDVPADPAVMRSVSRHGDRCFGVYADVAATGTLRVGDHADLEPPAVRNAVAASLGRLTGRLKSNVVRTGNRMLPR